MHQHRGSCRCRIARGSIIRSARSRSSGGGLTVIKAMACKKSEGEDFELNSKWRRLGICDHCWKMWFGWPGANMQMHIEKEAACFLAASIARATGTTGDDEKP